MSAHPASAVRAQPTEPVSRSPAPRIVAAIPARYGSQRLPGKALREIAGKPLIQHVFERVSRARGLSRVVVLTDDERIADVVRSLGGDVEMTPPECQSGTDRIAWAARSWKDAAECAVINIQGDEPLIAIDGIERVARHLATHPDDEMVTLSTALEPDEVDDPARVKVVTDRAGFALYFSRSRVPYPLHPGFSSAKLHVGLYGYRADVLMRLASLEQSPLERTESLEQLRALENGIRIRVLETDHRAFGVDTEADLAKAEAMLTETSAVLAKTS